MSQQKSVTSKDGTPIAYWHSGQGPPLVLVHGTAADHGRCAPVLPTFEQHFSVCAVDRRGRGASGDSEDYAIEREFEDIAAVVDSLGEPPILLGHSYGALCALEAVLLTRNVRKSVLYEPGIEMAGQELYSPSDIERLEALLGAGDRERVVATFMREVAGLPPETVEHMRSQPPGKCWYPRRTPSRGNCERARLTWLDAERFEALGVPTLVLSGGESPAALRKAAEAIKETLSDSRIVVMAGHGHMAMDTGTELFTTEVLRFVEAPSS